MMIRLGCYSFLVLTLLLSAPLTGQDLQEISAEPGDTVSAEGAAFFEKKIRPVLVKECFECHSAQSEDEVRAGLSLDTRQGIRQGGDSGPLIVVGKPAESLLIKALSHDDPDWAMPPRKKLDDAIIRDFEEWIRRGAPDPRADTPVVRKGWDIEEGRRHWAFQPVQRVEAPTVTAVAWPRTDVDRFILSALEERSLSPAADADRRTLLRRLSFDLTGLPPTPYEMESFVGDDSPAAYENAVDRLLSSPRFGEKWARHWLDVARYAESTGKTVNFYYPQAWRYRDYVISAFNADKPFDDFIREQLAGDLMPADDPTQEAERMIATGFLAIGPKTLNERSGLKFELDVVDEQIDVTTQAFLGITVACARCHDHKFDPIPQADYYALAGIFRSTETCYGTVRYINAQRPTPLLSLPHEADVVMAVSDLPRREREQIEDQIKGVRDSIKNMQDPIQQFFASGRISLLQARLEPFESDGTPIPLAMGVRDKRVGREFGGRRGRFGGPGGFSYDGQQTIADSPVYVRGEPDQPGESRVPRGTLQVMMREPLQVPPTTSGRLEFAEWIASKDNPLTARVMVNRVWLQLFGRGLVPTADDFGSAGRPPTHPELLDHLAHHFMDEDWSIKQLIKYLVMSHAYQLSTSAEPAAMEVDPDNVLLWRMAPRRLDAECLRDAMLAVSEQLETTPPVGSVVAQAGEGPVSRPFVRRDPVLTAINDPGNSYRSIYLPIIRDNLPEALTLFDAADPALITSDRPQTTVASQGLFLLNNVFVMRAADAAAEQLLQLQEADRIQEAFVRFFGRPPTSLEQVAAEQFIEAYHSRLLEEDVSRSRRETELWSAFCQALFASAEFQYRR